MVSHGSNNSPFEAYPGTFLLTHAMHRTTVRRGQYSPAAPIDLYFFFTVGKCTKGP